MEHHHQHDFGKEVHHQPEGEGQNFLKRFFIVTALLVPLFIFSSVGREILGVADFFWRKYLLFALASLIFYFSLIFFKHAGHEIKTRKFGMMTLVSTAVGAGYLFSAASTFLPGLDQEFYLEIATLIWVLLFGHWLEAKSSQTAGSALEKVAQLLPGKVHLLKNNKIRDIDIGQLKKGDIVLVRPGEKVPADGTILEGSSGLDESLLTGESKPVSKRKGDKVIAGSISQEGVLKVKVSKTGQESTIGQIKQLVAQAQNSKPEVQRLADRAAGWLTFIALLTALLTLAVWSLFLGSSLVFSLTLAITVLVISCPHALGLAIPTVSTIATSLALKNGLFIKDMAKLEIAKDMDYIIFDKTGTLTKGKFAVTDLKILTDLGRKKFLQLAASLEQNSSHVLAGPVKKMAETEMIDLLKVRDFKNIAGKGVGGVIKAKTY